MMTKTIDILHRLGYYLRAARGGSGVPDVRAGAAIGVSGQTVARPLAAPPPLQMSPILELFEVYEYDPGEALTRAVEDARTGAGAPTKEVAEEMARELKK